MPITILIKTVLFNFLRAGFSPTTAPEPIIGDGLLVAGSTIGSPAVNKFEGVAGKSTSGAGVTGTDVGGGATGVGAGVSTCANERDIPAANGTISCARGVGVNSGAGTWSVGSIGFGFILLLLEFACGFH